MVLPLHQESEDHLDEILTLVGQTLELPPHQHEVVAQHYKAVTEWLSDDGALASFDPLMYAQGSYSIATTVRPMRQDEYDLDFVLELRKNPRWTAARLLKELEERLRAHKVYASMVEPLKRCVRLNYEANFHMDILPSVSWAASPDLTDILVPDRKLEGWKHSNPKGYVTWFGERCRRRIIALDAKTEPLPRLLTLDEKAPLQRAVQLIKRWRDVVFNGTPETAPRSIVLTTLAGALYAGERTTAAAFGGIVNRLAAEVAAADRPLEVRNPANNAELLSEQWTSSPDAYWRFATAVTALKQTWNALVPKRGYPDIAKSLAGLFGEKATVTAIQEHADVVEGLRQTRNLRAGRQTVGLTSVGSGLAVPRNTFFGDD